MRFLAKPFLICLLMLAYTGAANAYVGPGLGAGALATVLGLFGGLLMLLVGVVWYPLKRLWKRATQRGN